MRLEPNECRVLGVLVEKAHTTQSQYPLTLNALTTGCNQKNNRAPITRLTEEDVLDAMDSLRGKHLGAEAMMSGSRVAKFRHHGREGLDASTSQLVILTELMLRGPQTVGEIRSRASRMHPLESIEVVENILAGLAERDPPFVRKLAPAPGSRAPRWAQMLCPDLHPLDAPASAPTTPVTTTTATVPDSGLGNRVERLERDVAALRAQLNALTTELGIDPDAAIE